MRKQERLDAHQSFTCIVPRVGCGISTKGRDDRTVDIGVRCD